MGRIPQPINLNMEFPRLNETRHWYGVYFSAGNGPECRLYCGNCNFASETPISLTMSKFHGFAYGGFIPQICALCGQPLLTSLFLNSCNMCRYEFMQLHITLHLLDLQLDEILQLVFDVGNKRILRIVASNPIYGQIFPRTFRQVI